MCEPHMDAGMRIPIATMQLTKRVDRSRVDDNVRNRVLGWQR
jgi:hypothetical protein